MLAISVINPLRHSGYYVYHQFNIQQFYILPTQCIYVFFVDLRANSNYFLYNINFVVCVTQIHCIYWAVWTESLNTEWFL
jgi:hypothetical protein